VSDTIEVNVLLFAVVADAIGTSRMTLQLPAGAMVGDVLLRLASTHPYAASLLDQSAIAVGKSFVPTDTPLKAGDEVAVIPPVSGG